MNSPGQPKMVTIRRAEDVKGYYEEMKLREKWVQIDDVLKLIRAAVELHTTAVCVADILPEALAYFKTCGWNVETGVKLPHTDREHFMIWWPKDDTTINKTE